MELVIGKTKSRMATWQHEIITKKLTKELQKHKVLKT